MPFLSAKWNANIFVQDLNSGRRFHFQINQQDVSEYVWVYVYVWVRFKIMVSAIGYFSDIYGIMKTLL